MEQDVQMSAPNDHELIANIQKSVDTCIQVLAHLESALNRGGFGKGLGAYQQMIDTVLSQKLWSKQYDCANLDAGFAEASASAQRIHEILAPYTAMMRKLALAGDLQQSTGPVAVKTKAQVAPPAKKPKQQLAHKLLMQLGRRAQPVSASTLRGSLGVARAELSAVLDELCESGVVVKKIRGGREMFVRAQ